MIDQRLIENSKTAAKFILFIKPVNQALGAAATVLLVHALSESDYGLYNLLYSTIALLGVAGSFGLTNTLQRYIPEYYQKKEFTIANRLYKTAALIRLVSNILLLGGVMVFWETISPLIKLETQKPFFMLFSLVIILVMQRPLINTCLSAYYLQKYEKPIAVLYPFIRIAGYGIAILSNQGIWTVILTDLIAHALVFTGFWMLYRMKIPAHGGRLKRFDKKEKKRLLKYALFYNFNEAGDGLLNSYFDNFIIILMMDQLAVGAYSFCVTMVVLLGQLLPMNYFLQVIRPTFFSANTRSTPESATLFFQNSIKTNLVFSIPCFFFLLLFGREVLQLFFDGKFSNHVPILCAIFFFFEVAYLPVGLIAQLREKANIILLSKIFAVYNLAADIILIHFWGLWGAVVATGTSVLFKNLFIWTFVREDASFSGMGRFYVKGLFFWGAVSGIGLGVKSLSSAPPAPCLALGTLIFASGFILQFQCNYFNEKEKEIWRLFSNNNRWLTLIFKRFNMLPAKENLSDLPPN